MDDLTIIYLTLNEMPEKWAQFQMEHLKKSIGDTQVISISRKTMDFGLNIIQKEPESYWNIYRQILIGALIAKTQYIGIAEDDTLYTKEHFEEYRPPANVAGYNKSRWSVQTWSPIYNIIEKIGNFAMIAPRELVVDALTERMKKHPDGNAISGEIGKRKVEVALGVTVNGCRFFESSVPIVNLCHRRGLSHFKKPGRKKKLGKMRAYEIPYWGKAEDIVRFANG